MTSVEFFQTYMHQHFDIPQFEVLRLIFESMHKILAYSNCDLSDDWYGRDYILSYNVLPADMSECVELTEYEETLLRISDMFTSKIYLWKGIDDQGNETKIIYVLADFSHTGFVNVFASLLPTRLGFGIEEIEPKYVEAFDALMHGNQEYLIKFLRENTPIYKKYKENLLKANPDFGKAQKIKRAEKTIRDLRDKINAMLSDLRIYQRDLSYATYELSQIKYIDNSNELFDYLKDRNDIYINAISDDVFEFQVETFLQVFDEDIMETYLQRSDDENRFLRQFENPALVRAFCKAVFIDRKVLIKTYATYKFNGPNAFALNGNFNQLTGIENPHYAYHRCLGDNGPLINEALMKSDYLLAFERCCAAAKAINLGESITVTPMIRALLTDLTHRNFKVGNESMTMNQLIDWLVANGYYQENGRNVA